MSETPAPKGHWPKGKSRNLEPNRVPAARVLVDLLRRAIGAGWRHPVHGRLTVMGIATLFQVDRTTVHRWMTGKRLPPLWAVDQLRALLRDYHV